MAWGLIMNSLVCFAGTIVGMLLAGGSLISTANMRVPRRGALLVAAILVPLTFLISGVGVWLTASRPVTLGLFALPWAYGLLFVVNLAVAVRQS